MNPELAAEELRATRPPRAPFTAADSTLDEAWGVQDADRAWRLARGYRFRLADVLADNTSAAAFVIGDWTDPAAAGHLALRGDTLPAGSIVLAGALTDAVPVERGVVYRAEIDRLGAVAYRP